MDWLERLEERVREAAGRIQTLRDENDRLVNRVKELEDQLAEAQTGDSTAWEQERDEIRTRVERLAESLTGLLEDEG